MSALSRFRHSLEMTNVNFALFVLTSQAAYIGKNYCPIFSKQRWILSVPGPLFKLKEAGKQCILGNGQFTYISTAILEECFAFCEKENVDDVLYDQESDTCICLLVECKNEAPSLSFDWYARV